MKPGDVVIVARRLALVGGEVVPKGERLEVDIVKDTSHGRRYAAFNDRRYVSQLREDDLVMEGGGG